MIYLCDRLIYYKDYYFYLIDVNNLIIYYFLFYNY